MSKTNPKTLATILFPILLTGCIGQPLLGPLLARQNSFVRDEQMMEIRWLDATQMHQSPIGVAADAWTTHVERECPGLLAPNRPKFLPGLLLPLVPIATEWVVDSLTKQLSAEAKLYAAQFTASATTSDSKQYVGFEVRRTARGFGDDHPACVIRFAFWQNEATDSRLALIRPLYFQTRAARAKLLFIYHSLDAQIGVVVRGISMDSACQLIDPIIAAGTFKISDYDLAAGKPLLLSNQTIALAAATMPSVLTATVAVTERDASHADETFQQLSTLLTHHRAALIAAATQPASR